MSIVNSTWVYMKWVAGISVGLHQMSIVILCGFKWNEYRKFYVGLEMSSGISVGLRQMNTVILCGFKWNEYRKFYVGLNEMRSGYQRGSTSNEYRDSMILHFTTSVYALIDICIYVFSCRITDLWHSFHVESIRVSKYRNSMRISMKWVL